MIFDWGIILTGIIGLVSTIVGSWSSYIFTKRKYNAEVDGAKIDNLKQIIDIQNEQIKNLSERLDIVLDRNKQLEQEVVDVRRQMFNLMSNICLDLTCSHRLTEVSKKRKGPKEMDKEPLN